MQFARQPLAFGLARGDFAALGIEGDDREVADLLTRLGPQYVEASYIRLGSAVTPG